MAPAPITDCSILPVLTKQKKKKKKCHCACPQTCLGEDVLIRHILTMSHSNTLDKGRCVAKYCKCDLGKTQFDYLFVFVFTTLGSLPRVLHALFVSYSQ